jgi:hypothetical protein
LNALAGAAPTGAIGIAPNAIKMKTQKLANNQRQMINGALGVCRMTAQDVPHNA